MKINRAKNPEGNDVIFKQETSDLGFKDLEEMFVSIRVASGSDSFIRIPVNSIKDRA